MSSPAAAEISVDLVPEVREFLLTGFTKTVTEITAKAHLVPQIEVIANDAELLRGLIERMQRGSKADVRSYVDEVFESFPFGSRPFGSRMTETLERSRLLLKWTITVFVAPAVRVSDIFGTDQVITVSWRSSLA